MRENINLDFCVHVFDMLAMFIGISVTAVLTNIIKLSAWFVSTPISSGSIGSLQKAPMNAVWDIYQLRITQTKWDKSSGEGANTKASPLYCFGLLLYTKVQIKWKVLQCWHSKFFGSYGIFFYNFSCRFQVSLVNFIW